MMIKLNRLFHFFKSDIWNIRIANLSDTRSFFLKQLRILLLAFHRLRKDQCSSKASALTYYSILSIIPILAIAFGIAKGFGVQNLLHQQILDNFAAQKEVLTPVMEYAIQLLDKTQGETVAVIGVIFLLWIIISLIKNIENSFNQIWQVIKSRNIGKKFNDYITILLIGPAFVLISSMAVFISTQLKNFTGENSIFFFINPITSSMSRYYEKTKSNFSKDIDHLVTFNKNGLCLNPAQTFVENIGHDGSGVHCGNSDTFTGSLSKNKKVCFVDFGSENIIALQRIQVFYKAQKKSLATRIINKLARVLIRGNTIK